MTTDNNKNNALLRLLNALKPDWTNRASYIGRIKQKEKVTVITEDGTPYEVEVEFTLSWDSIQQVLDLVRTKADTPDDLRQSTESQSDG